MYFFAMIFSLFKAKVYRKFIIKIGKKIKKCGFKHQNAHYLKFKQKKAPPRGAFVSRFIFSLF